MAQRVQVLLLCDLHDEEVDGSETIRFAFDGSTYEVDLCEKHAEHFRGFMGEYVGAARRASSASPAMAQPRRSPRVADAPRSQEVREWAKANGHAVNDRGRVPQTVVEAYKAAQG